MDRPLSILQYSLGPVVVLHQLPRPVFAVPVVRIGGSYVLAQGLGVWMAIFLDWGFRAGLFFIRFKQGKWRTREVLR